MAPDERRAAIVAAVTPVFREHGANATTRQLAAAAGVAEGTLFRVFRDKDAIIDAVVESVTEVGPWAAAVQGIDPTLPLRSRLVQATTILQQRIGEVVGIMMAIGRTRPQRLQGMRRPDPQAPDPLLDAVTAMVEPDASELRLPVADSCRLLRAMIFAGSHPFITDNHPLTPDEIVDVLLDGIRVREARDITGPTGTTRRGRNR